MGTESGEYTTKSGYEFAMTMTEEPQADGRNINWYQAVWNVPTAPKVRMLVWKALKGALPTSERLQDRHIDIEPNCKRCGAPESILHLFFQ